MVNDSTPRPPEDEEEEEEEEEKQRDPTKRGDAPLMRVKKKRGVRIVKDDKAQRRHV